APQAPGDGPRGRRSRHRRQARLRAVGANLLRRVRRPTAQARAGQGHRRVTAGGAAAWRRPPRGPVQLTDARVTLTPGVTTAWSPTPPPPSTRVVMLRRWC